MDQPLSGLSGELVEGVHQWAQLRPGSGAAQGFGHLLQRAPVTGADVVEPGRQPEPDGRDRVRHGCTSVQRRADLATVDGPSSRTTRVPSTAVEARSAAVSSVA